MTTEEKELMMEQVIDIKVDRLHKLDGSSKTKAFFDICINDVLVIRGMRIVDGSNGLFVSLPGSQGKDKKWYENVRCLRPEIRLDIEQKGMEAYNASGNIES